MTETAGARAGARKNGRGKGIAVERIYTTPGVHPYDEVTWEKRDVVQQNWKTGATIFEQRGVEFPDFWSVNASTIVTTKYFRGALGSDKREQSLKQLIDRVVLTYVKAGKDHGYFGTAEDAEIFEHELTYALLHQVFSFNSPVWFNVGTSTPAAGLGLLHPRGRRLDGLDPQLVQGGGQDLPGRLRRRPEPLPHPLLQGAAVLRRHGLRPGLLHARRRRLRGHHQVRWRHPPRGQDGRPRRRPPRHRGVRRDQGARGGQDPRAARRRLRHGPRRQGHHLRPVPERQQLGARHRRVHARGRGGHRLRPALAHHRRGHRVRRRPRPVPQDRPGLLGVRRPGPAVRRHHQRLAHQPRDRPHHRVQPVLGVHVARQLLVQPGVAQPAEVPQGRRHLRRRHLPEGRRARHHRDGHLHLLRGLPDRPDRRHHA